MTNTTKEQERAELHRIIWQIANDLRGSVDGWDFKQYVLGMLFYRFISENLSSYINTNEPEVDFDYAKLSDKEAEFGRADTVKEKGFYILPSELFGNVAKKAKNDVNLNETLAAIFRGIENSAKGTESEDDLKGLFDDLDVNSNKLGSTVEKRNQQLTKLLKAINSLRLGDYANNNIDAFTMHMLSWLSTSGTAVIVEFPGVLYRGGAEQKIRKYLIDNNYIYAVIQLPPDLFFGTTIATCIIILKKSKTDNKTLFIDASAEFVRGGNKNKLSEENRTRILEAYTHREDSEYFAQLVSNRAIGENDYNIAVLSYVEQEDTREVVNITELNQEIAQIVSKQNELRISIDAIVADIEGA